MLRAFTLTLVAVELLGFLTVCVIYGWTAFAKPSFFLPACVMTVFIIVMMAATLAARRHEVR